MRKRTNETSVNMAEARYTVGYWRLAGTLGPPAALTVVQDFPL